MPTSRKPVPAGPAGAAPRGPRRATGSAKARRSSARLAAVQVLYQIELTGIDPGAALAEYVKHRVGQDMDGDTFVEPDAELMIAVVEGIAARGADIDGMVSGALQTHQFDRLEMLLRAILRAGAWELMASHGTHARIVINDYVDVAHAFFAGREPAMVNGVLDRLARALRPDEMEGAADGRAG
jgi:N utilization substance protein B